MVLINIHNYKINEKYLKVGPPLHLLAYTSSESQRKGESYVLNTYTCTVESAVCNGHCVLQPPPYYSEAPSGKATSLVIATVFWPVMSTIDDFHCICGFFWCVCAGGVSLPPNKKWHLFVSHSTSSQDWTRDTIVARLTGSAHLMRVAACYQSMPDISKYNDKEIQLRMRESCAVLIALSPLYIKSER